MNMTMYGVFAGLISLMVVFAAMLILVNGDELSDVHKMAIGAVLAFWLEPPEITSEQ